MGRCGPLNLRHYLKSHKPDHVAHIPELIAYFIVAHPLLCKNLKAMQFLFASKEKSFWTFFFAVEALYFNHSVSFSVSFLSKSLG
ncbi:hypothetical protein ACJX0J_017575, partial [Zea mays]